MAEELHYSSDSATNKRKYDDNSPPPSAALRRQTGFSAPISDQSPPPASYNSVPPPADEIQLAKQKAQEIAARLIINAEGGVKRPRVDNNGDSNDDVSLKPYNGGMTPPMTQSYGYSAPSKKIEIPNGRVGVIIGKGGETIKYLQLQSGAKIQVTRDMDADPHSQSRGVELTGTPEQMAKAEQLIRDVLAEAEAGGSGLVSRRVTTGPHSGGAEQFVMKIPNNKVGLVIGKGGETIKNMQATTGARIQVIPLHLPPGDTSTERTCQIDGTSDQIEAAKQLVNEVISENRLRNPSMGGYQQQGYQARPPTNWSQGGAPMQQPGYGGYMQPGAYPGQNPQYNAGQAPYSGYPQPASGGYGSGWDQSGAPQAQQTSQGGGYDYYSQQPTAQQAPGGPGAPTESAAYGYGQAPASGYSQGQGYGQDGYGGYPAAAAQSYYGSQTNSAGGYDQQQGYNSTSGYGNASNPTPDGTASYGSQGDANQTTQPAQSAAPGQQGYVAGQQPSPNAAYQSQGGPGYSMPPSSQSAYGSQPPTGYGSGYGTQAQKPPANQPPYGQPQQSPSAQGGYPQSAPAYPPPAQSGYAAPTAQSGYAAPPYGAPAATQQSYGQQPPAYNSAYGGGYAQPAAYGDNGSGGSAQTTQPAKTSPPS